MTDAITPCVWLLRLGRDPADPAWSDLLRHCTADVYRVAYGVVRETATAEDIVQEVWLQVRRHAVRFRPSNPDDDAGARRWLRRIAIHCALNWRRGETRRHERERQSAAPPTAPSPLEEMARRERVGLVQDLMAGLRAPERELVVLHYFEGADHHALAAACGCSPAAARKRLQRAMDRLRDLGRQRGVAGALSLVAAVLADAEACAIDLPPRALDQALALTPQAAAHLESAGAGFPAPSLAGGPVWLLAAGLALGLGVGVAVVLPDGEPTVAATTDDSPSSAGPGIPALTGLFAREVVVDEADISLYDLMALVGDQVGRPMWCFDGSIWRHRLDLQLGRVTVAELVQAIDAQVPVSASIGMADDGGDMIELTPRLVE